MDTTHDSQAQDSPLSFSMPASLQEYVGRYMRSGDTETSLVVEHLPRAGSASSEGPFPVRHWFDDTADGAVIRRQRTSSTEVVDTPAVAAAPANAAGTAGAGNVPPSAPQRRDTAPGRSVTGSTLLGPAVESGCDDDEEPSRVVTAEVDLGGRPQTRSAPRDGRSRTMSRSRFSTGGTQARRRGGTIRPGNAVLFSPMVAGPDGHSNGRNSAMDSPRSSTGAPAEGVGPNASGSLETPLGRRFGGALENRRESDERPVDGSNGAPGYEHHAHDMQPRGRRSLSDFLREIEDMVVAQRLQAQRGPYDPPNFRAESMPRFVDISTWPTASSVPPVTDYSSGSSPESSTRYVPPAGRRTHTLRGRHRGAWVAGDTRIFPQSQRTRGSLDTDDRRRDEGAAGRVADLSAMATAQRRPMSHYSADDGGNSVDNASSSGRDDRASYTPDSGALGSSDAAQDAPRRSRFRLNAAATASRMGSDARRPQSTVDQLSMEDRARWVWRQRPDAEHRMYYWRRRENDAPAVTAARNNMSAAIAAVRERLNARVHTGREAGIAPVAPAGGAGRDGAAAEQQEQEPQHVQGRSGRRSYRDALAAEGPTLSVGEGARDTNLDTVGRNHRDLLVLPAFRHWESQRPRLRIQWQDPDGQSDANGVVSLHSDGTLTLTEHLSAGPSPRGFAQRACSGDGAGEISEVEQALFSSLSGIGVRRLLLQRGKMGSSNGSARNRETPEWLNEWLQHGARMSQADATGPSGEQLRSPQVGDTWELLQLLLRWWADQVCTVVRGIPLARSPPPDSPDAAESSCESDAGMEQTVEAVQALRELGECLLPLARVRDFIQDTGGPTPRDAVLLKAIVVIHEGIAWATDRPLYWYYRTEVIPTALALYASLPQDVLEGVDLEVGHTLPESMFVVTGTVRPSWPRWEEHHSPTRRAGEVRSLPSAQDDTAYSASPGGTGAAGGTRNNRGMRCAGGWGGSRGFMPGPWIVFRVTRGDYLAFYATQAVALDQAVGGLSKGLESMLC